MFFKIIFRLSRSRTYMTSYFMQVIWTMILIGVNLSVRLRADDIGGYCVRL